MAVPLGRKQLERKLEWRRSLGVLEAQEERVETEQDLAQVFDGGWSWSWSWNPRPSMAIS